MEGNQMKMRKALELIRSEMLKDSGFGLTASFHAVIDELTQDALSAPPRNCDVGTPEEQTRRFDAFCAAHHFQSEKCCSNCPCRGADNCEFKWGQLPYE